MDSSKKPLSIIMQETKFQLVSQINKIIYESGLPAYLVEGIILSILSDVREQKFNEICCEYSTVFRNNQEEGDEE